MKNQHLLETVAWAVEWCSINTIKKVGVKNMAKIVGRLCNQPENGEMIKQTFVETFSTKIKIFCVDTNQSNEDQMIADAEVFAFATIHLYKEGVFSDYVLKKILRGLSSSTETTSIIHLRVIFIILHFFTGEFLSSDRHLCISTFSEKITEVFKPEIERIENEEEDKESPKIREYWFFFETILSVLQTSTRSDADHLNNLNSDGLEKYLSHRTNCFMYKMETKLRMLREEIMEEDRMLIEAVRRKEEIAEKGTSLELIQESLRLDRRIEISSDYALKKLESHEASKKRWEQGYKEFQKMFTELYEPPSEDVLENFENLGIN